MFRTKIKKREAEIIKIINSLSDCTPEEKEQKIHSIQALYALELFDNKQYSQSLKEFNKLNTDPADIIKLYPELDYDNKEKIKKMTGKDLESALKALIMYLKELKANIGNSTGQQDEATATSTQHLELIDTTLLKCYLQINHEVASLLGVKNNCRLEEAEKMLLQHGKYSELIILYQTKGQHVKALQLLRVQAKEPDSSLEVYQVTINYLQQLGVEHIDLIFEFSDWILKEYAEQGLKIFTEEKVQVRNLPRPKILDFLFREHESLVIPYLEHVIHTWDDTNSLFHDTLINMYRDKITVKKANLTDAEIQHVKSKLVAFLEKSAYYTPERVAVHFPADSLFEERAIFYGKLGRHEQALAIYVIILGDVDRALRYCEDVTANPNDKSQEDVYVILMKILINPEQDSGFIGNPLAKVPRHPKTSVPDLETALQILEKHVDNLSPLKALSVLPDSVPLNRLKHFLESALHGQLTLKRRMQILKGLSYAEFMQVQELKQFHESKSMIISEGNVCPVCKRRFGNQSAFVRYPNGGIVHFSCRLDK